MRPTRTLQRDVEFGVIQIVDIALRAISPAVNDPTTAINCIDQLSRIMIVWTSRAAPPSCLYAPPYVLRVMVPWISYEGLLDTAFEQIRHYAKSDIAVSLRLLRAFDDMVLAGASHKEIQSLIGRARRVVAGCELNLDKDGRPAAEAAPGATGRPLADAVGGRVDASVAGGDRAGFPARRAPSRSAVGPLNVDSRRSFKCLKCANSGHSRRGEGSDRPLSDTRDGGGHQDI